MADYKYITNANLMADDAPDQSYHLQLESVALPDIQQTMVDHNAGGSGMGIRLAMEHFEALMIGFKLSGFDEGMLARLGLNSGRLRGWTIFKEVRDTRTGEKKRLVATARGVLASSTQDAYNKTTLSGFDYQIDGIRAYTLHYDSRRIFDFDWHASRLYVGDTNLMGETNQILGIV